MKNFKTTLAGLLAGLPMAIDALTTAFNEGYFDGKTGWQLTIAIAVILLGCFANDAKDHNPIKPETEPERKPTDWIGGRPGGR